MRIYVSARLHVANSYVVYLRGILERDGYRSCNLNLCEKVMGLLMTVDS